MRRHESPEKDENSGKRSRISEISQVEIPEPGPFPSEEETLRENAEIDGYVERLRSEPVGWPGIEKRIWLKVVLMQLKTIPVLSAVALFQVLEDPHEFMIDCLSYLRIDILIPCQQQGWRPSQNFEYDAVINAFQFLDNGNPDEAQLLVEWLYDSKLIHVRDIRQLLRPKEMS